MRNIFFISFFTLLNAVYFNANAQNYAWSNQYGGSQIEQVYASIPDNNGHVYVTGTFSGTVDFQPGSGVYNMTCSGVPIDIFLAKYTTTGTLVWAFSIGHPSASDYSNEISLDPFGNVIITGIGGNVIDFDPGVGTDNGIGTGDMFMAKYTSTGSFLWANRIGNSSSGESWDLVTDKTGAVYWTGMFQGGTDFDPSAGVATLLSSGLKDIFVAKYDVNGNYQWAFKLGTSGIDYSKSIAVDTLNNIYVTGGFSGTIDFDPGAGTNNLTTNGAEDIFLAKYTSAGNHVWAFHLGGGAADYGLDVTVDRDQNIVLGGQFYATVDFDPSASVNSLAGVATDLFVAKYSPSGNYIRAIRAGGPSGEAVSGIATDTLGNVYITGTYSSTSIDLDPGVGVANHNNYGGSDIFIAKYDSLLNYTWSFIVAGSGNDTGKKIIVDTSNNVFLSGWFQTAIDCDPSAGSAVMNTTGSYDGFFSAYNQLPCIVPDIPVISADTTICQGATVTLNINSGNLNSASNWQWYSGSCNGTSVGTGTSLNVSPTSTLSYFVRGNGGCITSGSCSGVTITVNPNPVISFTQSPNEICIDGGMVPISSATPSGGLFSGTGVSGTNFDPLIAGAGIWPINYSYTDGNGCSNNSSQNITVYDLPVVINNQTITEVCIDAPPFFITNATPFGGFYTGNGLTGATFTASTAGAGTHVIEYFYTDSHGCMNSDTSSITVYDLPAVNFIQSPNSVCIYNNSFLLTDGTPTGGTYSGNGVNSGMFDPAIAGVGTHSISYTYTDPITGCDSTATSSIVVDQCLGVDEYSNDELIIYPNPSTGIFSIQGIKPNTPIRIYNSLGEIVFAKNFNGNESTIDISELPSGVYFITNGDDNKSTRHKLIILK